MVAQQIKTIDFDAGIEFNQRKNHNSVIGMLQGDKFSNKISPLIKDNELNEQPVYILNSTHRNTHGQNLFGKRSYSTCDPQKSFYPMISPSDSTKALG